MEKSQFMCAIKCPGIFLTATLSSSGWLLKKCTGYWTYLSSFSRMDSLLCIWPSPGHCRCLPNKQKFAQCHGSGGIWMIVQREQDCCQMFISVAIVKLDMQHHWAIWLGLSWDGSWLWFTLVCAACRTSASMSSFLLSVSSDSGYPQWENTFPLRNE